MFTTVSLATALRGATTHLLRGSLACFALSAGAQAHVTLERGTASPNATYRAVFQVNHGCGGAATTAVRVTIPEGVIAARPMPKPGWSVAIAKAPYAKSYKLYGEDLTAGPKEIGWTGGEIPDDQYDEFVVVARVTADFAPGSTVYFPVVQECGAKASRWIELPAPGQDAHALKNPAPGVRIAAPGAVAGAAAMPEHEHDMSAMGGTAPAAVGGPVKVGALTLTAPWLRATPGGAKVAGGYLRITNGGSEPDTLVSASIPLAARGEVHEMSNEGGVMKMAQLERGLTIAPGATVELKPGGFHLMFMDLSGGLKQGETVKGRLVFAKAGPVDVSFQVGGLGAQGAPAQN